MLLHLYQDKHLFGWYLECSYHAFGLLGWFVGFDKVCGIIFAQCLIKAIELAMSTQVCWCQYVDMICNTCEKKTKIEVNPPLQKCQDIGTFNKPSRALHCATMEPATRLWNLYFGTQEIAAFVHAACEL